MILNQKLRLKILKDHQKFSVWFDARYAALFLTHKFAIHFSPPILMFFCYNSKIFIHKIYHKIDQHPAGGGGEVTWSVKKLNFVNPDFLSVA